MKGKVVVITGSNVGIGKETAVGLAAQGATTVLACRNQEKAASAATEVRERAKNEDVHVLPIDLADLASVRDCATAILEKWDRVDVLVNNAGGILTERRTTKQGFEQTFGVNHLGPFYLTNLLLDRLVASAPARVVNLASVGHHYALRGIRWDDLQRERGYSAMDAYAQSKLANVLFTRALARRYPAKTLAAYAVHPGAVRSGFGLDGDLGGVYGFGNRLIRPFEVSAAVGARTSIFVASDPSVADKSGGYWYHKRRGFPSRASRDDNAAERLWTVSEKLLADAGFPV